MDQDNSAAYYRRREAGARRMAFGSSDEAIKRIHNDMADRYAAKVRDLTARPKLTLT